jgi:hypothetical protein
MSIHEKSKKWMWEREERQIQCYVAAATATDCAPVGPSILTCSICSAGTTNSKYCGDVLPEVTLTCTDCPLLRGVVVTNSSPTHQQQNNKITHARFLLFNKREERTYLRKDSQSFVHNCTWTKQKGCLVFGGWVQPAPFLVEEGEDQWICFVKRETHYQRLPSPATHKNWK